MHSSWLIGGILGIHISPADVSLLVSIQSRGVGEGGGEDVSKEICFKMASKVFIEEKDKNSILSGKYRSDFLDLELLRFLLP